jgi:hypothetical protein
MDDTGSDSFLLVLALKFTTVTLLICTARAPDPSAERPGRSQNRMSSLGHNCKRGRKCN